MKKVLLVCLVLFLAVGLTSAGERKTASGDHALSFMINGLGDFGVRGPLVAHSNPNGSNGDVMGVAGKYFINNDMAIRAYLGFMMDKENRKATTGVDERDYKDTWFGVQPALLWYCTGEGPVTGYWGPMVMWGMYTNEQVTTPVAGSDYKDTYTVFGGGLVFGAEWWAWDMISFNAEYQLTYKSWSGDSQTQTTTGTATTDNNGVTSFGFSDWAVGINVFLR